MPGSGQDGLGVVDRLLGGGEPAVELKVRVGVLGEALDSPRVSEVQERVRTSALVARLLSGRDASGRVTDPSDVYATWRGAHWVMAALADIGYPPHDSSLQPVRDQLLDHWLGADYYTEFVAESGAGAYRHRGVPVIGGRHRRCASQQAGALWSILRLGLEDERVHALVERLLHWQWPDGGWNCDKAPSAHHSSYMESILPLRALALYGERFDDDVARDAARRVSEIFLERRLYLRKRDGVVMRPEFVALHYPLYWHYDVLHGLKVLAESGYVTDPRCSAALDLLESKRLPDGGWPAERRYHTTSPTAASGTDYVDWAGASRTRSNPWVTVDALAVLRAAGRDLATR